MTDEKKTFIIRMMWYLIVAAIFALIIPIIFNVCKASDVTKIGFVMFGFDMIFSVLVGLYAGKNDDSWIPLLFFPILFVITAGSFFLGILRVVAVIYLAASLLAYGITKK